MRCAAAIFTAVLVCCPMLSARPAGNSSDPLAREFSGAIDAKGIRHRGSDHASALKPWMPISGPGIAYPYDDMHHRREGVGLFRLILDLKAGLVKNVTIVKSTGFRTLDNSVLIAVRQWHWKPGQWKEIDLPVTFTVASWPFKLPTGAAPFPRPTSH